MEGARSVGSIRLAELMAALSLATDLGLGQPLQHEVGVCLASLEHAGALAALAPLAGAHHERLDGSGYHRGSKAAAIGRGARVMAVADAYDAMTHDRPYRTALSAEQARAALREMVCGSVREGLGRRRAGGRRAVRDGARPR